MTATIRHSDTAVIAQYDTTGHRGEWVVNLPGYDQAATIPDAVNDALASLIGTDFAVHNCGTQLELHSTLGTAGHCCRQQVTDALTRLIRATPTLSGAPLVIEVDRRPTPA